ncbi:MAG TPA: PP2C family protein-serine/threonine phosphatase [Candidatus Limnocylindria bacterium]|nr:PP2C family protein-serine/threonine phosphatase [Candidatus Limnocylindria bacterium]
MSTIPNAVPPSKRKRWQRTRDFWARVTEGLEISELWGQFKSEAHASYGLYAKDVDWDEIGKEKKRVKRFFLAAWALFQAMLMKLSPARRVLLLLAVILLIFQPDIRFGENEVTLGLGWVGAAILFVLLALELGDRVTMKRDLEIAREIQQWLVPDHPPLVSGIDIAFATRPQNTVAGDYYDAFLRPVSTAGSGNGALLVVVADVAGKSVPAALLMATFQASLKALSSTHAPLDEIVAGLTSYTRAHSLEGRRFTTAFLAEINPETREMRYVNAGHNDPILRRASGEIERLSAGGPPFGLPLFSDNEIPYESGQFRLQSGDLLFIFTDGVVEAVNETGHEYGESRLVALLEATSPETAAETLKRVMADVNQFVGFARQHDDITCLVLRVSA